MEARSFVEARSFRGMNCNFAVILSILFHIYQNSISLTATFNGVDNNNKVRIGIWRQSVLFGDNPPPSRMVYRLAV